MTRTVTDTALVLGATMRLTRAVVTDDIGQWWVKDPLDRWMHQHPPTPAWDQPGADPLGDMHRLAELAPNAQGRMRWHRYLSGLDCPFCVGFWIGAAVLASHAVASATGLLRPWRFVASALTLNEVAAHAGIQIGDF